MSLTPGIYLTSKFEKITWNDTFVFEDARIVLQGEAAQENMLAIRDALIALYPLEEHLQKCELCDYPATTTAQDELGNDCLVCADHAEALAAKTAERQADEYHDQTYKSGD